MLARGAVRWEWTGWGGQIKCQSIRVTGKYWQGVCRKKSFPHEEELYMLTILKLWNQGHCLGPICHLLKTKSLIPSESLFFLLAYDFLFVVKCVLLTVNSCLLAMFEFWDTVCIAAHHQSIAAHHQSISVCFQKCSINLRNSEYSHFPFTNCRILFIHWAWIPLFCILWVELLLIMPFTILIDLLSIDCFAAAHPWLLHAYCHHCVLSIVACSHRTSFLETSS